MKNEFPRPNGGTALGALFSGPHWSPVKSDALLIEQSGDEGSFKSPSIQGVLLAMQAYGRDAFGLRPEGYDAVFLLPDHTQLTRKLQEAPNESTVYIEYVGEGEGKSGHRYYSYDVILLGE